MKHLISVPGTVAADCRRKLAGDYHNERKRPAFDAELMLLLNCMLICTRIAR